MSIWTSQPKHCAPPQTQWQLQRKLSTNSDKQTIFHQNENSHQNRSLQRTSMDWITQFSWERCIEINGWHATELPNATTNSHILLRPAHCCSSSTASRCHRRWHSVLFWAALDSSAEGLVCDSFGPNALHLTVRSNFDCKQKKNY